MDFKDYQGRKIILSEESWIHIQDVHPEITLDRIAKTLLDPDEVRKASKIVNAELFYQLKILYVKSRYCCVVVKIIGSECFISTAMTTSCMKSGLALYKKA